MSRFEEVVNDAIGEVVLGESALRAETLAQHIAEKVRDRQGARRAEVHIEARYPEHKPAPESGILTQEIYSLLGVAVASEAGTRRLVGVRAQGMTACPCAQKLVEGRSRERLQADGFSDDEIERIFEAVPVATHNQRGLGTLHIGCPEDCDERHRRRDAARDRRGLDVVGDLRAHEALRRGRRGREGAPPPAVRRGLRARDGARRDRGLPDLTDRHFVSARQENLETIHQHNVTAERFGLVGEMRTSWRPASTRVASRLDARVARRPRLADRDVRPSSRAPRGSGASSRAGRSPASSVRRSVSLAPGARKTVPSDVPVRCGPRSRGRPSRGWWR